MPLSQSVMDVCEESVPDCLFEILCTHQCFIACPALTNDQPANAKNITYEPDLLAANDSRAEIGAIATLVCLGDHVMLDASEQTEFECTGIDGKWNSSSATLPKCVKSK